jgi:hypothetical protein
MRVSVALFAGGIVALTSCAHRNEQTSRSEAGAEIDYCGISIVALQAAVRTQEEQPLGLDPACVRQYAAFAGKIYVDARFMKDGALEAVSEKSCTRDNFIIRFDDEHDTPSPAPGVLFLSVSPQTPAGRDFYVTIEDANWTKRAPAVLAMPPCYPAFGRLNYSAKAGWTAKVVPAPRGPDDL